VNVVFTVTDKHGHYVKDLKKDNFKVVDDKKPPAEIRSFRAEANLPLEVGLLVDASNSVRDRFKFEQQAAVEFLNQTIRPKYDKAFVVGFDVTPEVTQDFTDNTELLSIGVRSLRPGGGTAMYDALYFACRDKLIKAQHVGPVRRAIILLTDGEDNQSHVTREEAIEMAQRADVIVYTISTNLSGAGHHGDKVLNALPMRPAGALTFLFRSPKWRMHLLPFRKNCAASTPSHTNLPISSLTADTVASKSWPCKKACEYAAATVITRPPRRSSHGGILRNSSA